MGRNYGLIKIFLFYTSFDNWVSDFDKSVTIIAISNNNLYEEYLNQCFEEVTKIEFIEYS